MDEPTPLRRGEVPVGMEAEAPTRRARDGGGRPRDEVVREIASDIAETAQKLVGDRTSVADMKLIHSSLKEMRRAFRVFAQYEGMRKVSTFGSARTPPGSPAYEQAREFSLRMADAGYMIITGAGPGIMRACNEGSGRDRSFGINIRLPFEQSANDIIDKDPKLVTFKYFFTRKLMFVKEADAIALFPGGFGTHDEGFESLTLIQTGKSRPLPVVFIDAPGGSYWKTWKRYVRRHLLNEGLISEADMRLFKVTDDLDQAIHEITHFYSRYHSSRFVGDRLVLRLNTPLSKETIAALNDEYGDIVARGKIHLAKALPEEANEPELAELPRLVFHSARRHFGRLRMLIDDINDA